MPSSFRSFPVSPNSFARKRRFASFTPQSKTRSAFLCLHAQCHRLPIGLASLRNQKGCQMVAGASQRSEDLRLDSVRNGTPTRGARVFRFLWCSRGTRQPHYPPPTDLWRPASDSTRNFQPVPPHYDQSMAIWLQNTTCRTEAGQRRMLARLFWKNPATPKRPKL